MNLKEFICNSLTANECNPFDMQKALKQAQIEAESNYSLRQKAIEKDLLPCYSSN